ncbi:MAG TPA: Rieske (2Fe-2S) protein [Solirubrobacteraceae bacterium]|jgi:3-phenylpropionate/trans-cinnamate dioxygenase ferredoxin subunit
MARHIVCPVDALPPGTRKIVSVRGGGPGIGVFNVGGRLYAIKNTCPHQGGPLCLGPVCGTARAVWPPSGPPQVEWVREGEILRCPWHGWEFELSTGRLVAPLRDRVKTYDVTVEAGAEVKELVTYQVNVDDGYIVVDV